MAGIAAVLQGAPVLTQDVAIVYRIEAQNMDRLERALDLLHAVARGDPRRLRFDRTHLVTKGQKLSETDAGPLDVLGSINDGLVYEDLIGLARRSRWWASRSCHLARAVDRAQAPAGPAQGLSHAARSSKRHCWNASGRNSVSS